MSSEDSAPTPTQDDGPFAPAPGVEVGSYTLLERLGRGSMGEVWSAQRGDEAFALKIPLRPAFLRHLRKERLFLATVEHPNVAQFVEADLDSEPNYLVTELVRGQPLRALCRGTISPHGATLICDQLLAGLAAIHEAGILHLDLKPENVIVQQDGQVKIVDLGLGRATTRFMEEVYLSVSLASRVPAVAGTLAYMSPEQRKGKQVDARADLFAFGILLHELLTGQLPEPGKPITDFREELAPRWDVVVSRLTHPDPEQRPKDANQVRHLVSFTLAAKAAYAVPKGGAEPRDLLSFDEETFAQVSPYVPGMVIGEGYELEQILGRGGFGEVWRVRRGEERFALKVVLSEAAREGLAKEADVARRVEHAGVPDLVADCSAEQPPHVVFRLVEGKSLRLIIHEEELLSLAAALGIAERMFDVVDSCARADVVHMDLKPEHFLVDGDWERPSVSLIDFGLAALVPAGALDGSLGSEVDIRGTLDYMAPEQREGRASPAVDVYALGLCLFELLTLSLPKGPQRLQTLRRDVPHELDQLVHAMLAPDPRQRPSLASCLETLRTVRGGLRQRRGVVGRPGAVRMDLGWRLRRLLKTLPPRVVVFLVGLAGLGAVTLAVRGPGLWQAYQARAFSPGYVARIDRVAFEPDERTLTELGELPQRSGRVLIVRSSIGHQQAGYSRPARIDPEWHHLPEALKARSPSQVSTLISVFRAGPSADLTVYDLPSERMLGRFHVKDYPKFEFGSSGRLSIARFVQLMPWGHPKPLPLGSAESESEPAVVSSSTPGPIDPRRPLLKPAPAEEPTPEAPSPPGRRSSPPPGNGE